MHKGARLIMKIVISVNQHMSLSALEFKNSTSEVITLTTFTREGCLNIQKGSAKFV